MRLLITILLFISVPAFSQVVKVNFSRAISYNSKGMGRAAALTDEQDTTQTPASCGIYYLQHPDSVKCFIGFNAPTAPDFPYQPWPTQVIWDLRAHYNITRVMLWIETYSGTPSPGEVGLNQSCLVTASDNNPTNSGWEDTLARVRTPADGPFDKWITIDVTTTNTRFLQWNSGLYFGIAREMVIYATLIDTIAKPAPVTRRIPTLIKPTGNNIGYNDGVGMDYITFNPINFQTIMTKRARRFSAMNFFTEPNDDLSNGGQGLGYGEAIETDRFYDNGVLQHDAFVSVATDSMIDPAHPSNAFLNDRKPIDYTIPNSPTDRVLDGVNFRDSLAEIPASYARAASVIKKFARAIGTRAKPMYVVEIGNEFDGKFTGAMKMTAFEMAAFCSALYDGHENTIIHNGEDSLGVKNCGVPGMKMAMPGLANIVPAYLEAMDFWFKHNRTDGKFASDFINVHAYATSAGLQGSGQDGYGLHPESNVYDLEGKIDFVKRFADSLAPHTEVLNTEYGNDTFDSLSYRGQYCELNPYTADPFDSTTYGNSFVNPHNIPGKTIEEIQGEWSTRYILTHLQAGFDAIYQFWLTDRIQEDITCGTFNRSGELGLDTIIGFVQSLRKRPAWFYHKTVDSLVAGKKFVSNRLITSGSDSIRVQKYRDATDTLQVLYVLWSPTAKNDSINNYLFAMDELTAAQIITMEVGDDNGVYGATTLSNNILVNVNEKPMFIYGEEIIDNLAPTANAGSDVSITLPIDDILLAGSGTDPDGSIVSYLWSYFSGPSDPVITNGSTANATVSDLLAGVYLFQLTVTDNDGATDIDIKQVTVNPAIVAPSGIIREGRFKN